MTTAEILQITFSVGGCSVVLQRPTTECSKHIAACRTDGVAIGILSSKISDDLVESNFVRA